MPVVMLHYKESHVLESTINLLAAELTGIVAHALDVPGIEDEHLTPEDIEIWVMPSNKLDVNVKDIEILVNAHDYPERSANIEERKDQIIERVHSLIEKYDMRLRGRGWVWIHLHSTAFGRI